LSLHFTGTAKDKTLEQTSNVAWRILDSEDDPVILDFSPLRDQTSAGDVLLMLPVVPFDVLVLCCGSKGLRPFRELSPQQLDVAIDGNLKGNFMLAKELGYWMKQTGSLGKIIQLSAMSAENPSHSAYGLGKAAQNAMADFLAYKLAPEVTINTIAPITIDQDPTHDHPPADAAPLGRQVHARELARMCIMLCDPVFDTVTAEIIRMDSGRHVVNAFPRDL